MQLDEITSTAGQGAAPPTRAAASTIKNPGANPAESDPLKEATNTKQGQAPDAAAKAPEGSEDRSLEVFEKYIGWGNFDISYSRDEETNALIVKLIDRETGDVLRQIPPEQLLALKQHLREVLGIVFDQMA